VVMANWHPLTILSHMLDCQLFGTDRPGWHHLVNLALHAANTVLLFVVLRRMTGAVWRSALVAALFGLHPLHVESVAWISERKDVLSTFFFMLVLLAYHRYALKPSLPGYGLVILMLSLGLMSKPMLVTVPFVLLLLDYWPLGRLRTVDRGPEIGDQEPGGEEGEDEDSTEEIPAQDDEDDDEEEDTEEDEIADEETADAVDESLSMAQGPRPTPDDGKLSLQDLIAEKAPLFILVAVSAVITFIAQRIGGAMGMLGENLPLTSRLGNAVCAYGDYLEKSFWPYPLVAIYPYVNRKLIDVLIIGVALGAISFAAFRLAKLKPYLLIGWCWYLGTLVPVIGLVQVGVQSIADRYTYIPLIGFFIIAVWGGAELTEAWPAWRKAVVVAVVLAILSWFTFQQVQTWSSSEVLFNHAATSVPNTFVAMNGLANVYWKEKDLDKAKAEYEKILKIEENPNLRVEGGLEPAHRALGVLLAVMHQPKDAYAQLDLAMKLRPQQADPRRHKAWLLATYPDETYRSGAEAVRLAKEAFDLASMKTSEYWDTLAVAYAEAWNFKEATDAAEKALEQARLFHEDNLIPGLEERLRLFRAGMQYHAEPTRPNRL
jgi:protein O-mannosyl-transferase